jgi:hypothetical protein
MSTPITTVALRVTTEKTFTARQLSSLLCSAFEGGSNWYVIDRYEGPVEHLEFKHTDAPFVEGGAIIVMDEEEGDDKEFRVDIEAIKRGLQIMAEKYPRHYANFVDENDDAITGDVFLQCCTFGEVIYG